MIRIRSLAVFFCLSLFVAGMAAPGAVRADTDKVLNMYVAYGDPGKIAAEFKKDTGIQVKFLTMSSGEVLTRLRAEKLNPGSDVWFGGGSDAFIQAAKEKLIAPYMAPNAKDVAPAFKDADGYWTGVSLVVVGFTVNTDRIKKRGLTIPKTWTDLTSPKYNDEILASNPNTSGTAYTTVSGILQIFGDEQGWKTLGKIYDNVPFLTKSGSAPGKKALAGEFAIGISPDPHIMKLRNPDAPLQAVFPTDGVLAWPSPVALIAGCKHPENAKAFINWSLSPRGQKVLMQASPRVPTTKVKPIAGVPSLSDLPVTAYDIRKWGAEREKVVKKFNKTFPKFR